MRCHPVRAAGRTGQQISAFGETPHCSIVKHHTIFAQHERIAPATNRQPGNSGRANDLKKCRSIGSADFELCKRGNVGHANSTANRLRLAQRRVRQ